MHFAFTKLIFIINIFNIILETALISTTLNEDNNSEVSSEATQAQSTTALSVLYNSEYINGKLYLIHYMSIHQFIEI